MIERENQYDDDLILSLDDIKEDDAYAVSEVESNADGENNPQVAEKSHNSRAEKRIKQLTWEKKSAIEREKAALARVEQQDKRIAELEQRFNNAEKATSSAQIDSQIAELKKQKRQALEDMDYDKLDELDDAIFDLRSKKTAQPERSQERQQQQESQQPQQPQQPQMPKAKADYVEKNISWIQGDPEKTSAADTILKQLYEDNYSEDEPEIWQELDKRLSILDALRKHGHKLNDPNTLKLLDVNLKRQRRPSGETGSATQTRSATLSEADKQEMAMYGLNPNDKAVAAEWLKQKGGNR